MKTILAALISALLAPLIKWWNARSAAKAETTKVQSEAASAEGLEKAQNDEQRMSEHSSEEVASVAADGSAGELRNAADTIQSAIDRANSSVR